MADETSKVGVEVDVSVNGAKTVGQLKKELREAQGQALALSREFGELSPQAIAATKRVVELKDEVNDLNERIALFDPGAKFMAFGNVVNTITAGFTAAQGAMAVFGGESEDLQKQLVKLQGAMAVSQGLSTLADSWKDFQRLGAIVRTQVVGAFTTLKGAIAATGIGLLVVAIGALVTNFEAVEKWLKKIIPGFDGFANAFNKVKAVASGVMNGIIEGFKLIGEIISEVFDGDFSGAWDSAKSAGQRMGQAYSQGFQEEVAAQAESAMRKAIEAQIKAQERNLKILQASGEKRQKEALDLERKILVEKTKLYNQDTEEYKDAVAELTAFEAKSIADREAKAKEQAKTALEKRKESGRKLLQELESEQARELRIAESLNKNLREIRERHYQSQLELAIKYGLDLTEIQNRQKDEIIGRSVELNNALKDRVVATSGVASKALENLGQAQQNFQTTTAASAEITAAATAQAELKKQQALQATNDLLTALVEDKENLSDLEKAAAVASMVTTMFAEEGKRSAMEMTQIALKMATKVFGEETAAGKAFAIATATIETYKAAQMSFSAFAAIPIVGPALGAVAAAAAIVAGIARVRQITKVRVPGGDKGSGSTPSADTSAPVMPRVQGDTGTMVQQLDQVNSNLQQPQRVQVVESDITDTQDKVKKTEVLSSF